METITIEDPGYPWDAVAPFLLAVLIGVVLFIIAISITSTRKTVEAEKAWAWVHSVLAGLTVAALFFGLLMGAGVAPAYYGHSVRWEKIDALEELGYAEADIEDDGSFVADREGTYFKGFLVPLGDNTWQVVERGESK